MHLLLVLLPLGILLLQTLEKANAQKSQILSRETQKEIVDTLNTFRRSVSPTASNMLKVIWDPKASESARKWAVKCSLTASDVMTNRFVDGLYCGESLSASNFVRSWTEVIEQWAKGKSTFKYGVVVDDQNEKTKTYGYTQVVWYKSYRVGCALTYCPAAEQPFYYVCHFCPSGNINEKLPTPYKEGPSCGDCPKNCDNKLCTNPCKYENTLSDCKEIVEMLGCKHSLIQKRCQASCTCKTEII